MSDKRHDDERAAAYLNELLDQAARAGADTIELERVPEGLEICFLRAGSGSGTILKDSELEDRLFELIVRRAGLENRAEGTMDWNIGGRDYAIRVEEYESFDETCFRLKLGKMRA